MARALAFLALLAHSAHWQLASSGILDSLFGPSPPSAPPPPARLSLKALQVMHTDADNRHSLLSL